MQLICLGESEIIIVIIKKLLKKKFRVNMLGELMFVGIKSREPCEGPK